MCGSSQQNRNKIQLWCSEKQIVTGGQKQYIVQLSSVKCRWQQGMTCVIFPIVSECVYEGEGMRGKAEREGRGGRKETKLWLGVTTTSSSCTENTNQALQETKKTLLERAVINVTVISSLLTVGSKDQHGHDFQFNTFNHCWQQCHRHPN